MTGTAGWAAPRLKDAALSLDKLREGYMEVWLDVISNITVLKTLLFKPKPIRIFFYYYFLFCVVLQMIMVMRTLYQKCKLVHGDLSEYNILYFEVSIYFLF